MFGCFTHFTVNCVVNLFYPTKQQKYFSLSLYSFQNSKVHWKFLAREGERKCENWDKTNKQTNKTRKSFAQKLNLLLLLLGLINSDMMKFFGGSIRVFFSSWQRAFFLSRKLCRKAVSCYSVILWMQCGIVHSEELCMLTLTCKRERESLSVMSSSTNCLRHQFVHNFVDCIGKRYSVKKGSHTLAPDDRTTHLLNIHWQTVYTPTYTTQTCVVFHFVRMNNKKKLFLSLSLSLSLSLTTASC